LEKPQVYLGNGVQAEVVTHNGVPESIRLHVNPMLPGREGFELVIPPEGMVTLIRFAFAHCHMPPVFFPPQEKKG